MSPNRIVKSTWLAIALMAAVSCSKDELDALTGGAQNLTFTQLMAPTPYAMANTISVSENEKYIVISYQENTTVKHYYSTNGGQSVQALPIQFSFNDRNTLIDSNISNDGLLTIKGIVYDLDSPNGSITSALAVTQTGKIIDIQNDPLLGKNAFYVYENGAFVSTGVHAKLDKSNYAGVSGEKLGFFVPGTKTIAEFDVTAKVYTEKQLSSLDYTKIGGNGLNLSRVKIAYSQGYFAYAKEGGCLIISPSEQITYYNYPSEFQSYLNTEGGLKLFGDKAYVNIYSNTGALAVFKASGNAISKTEYVFPLKDIGGTVYTHGFIENGDRAEGGIIKYKNGAGEYLPLSYGNSSIDKSYLVGEYVYMRNKVYDVNKKTYATSPIGEVISLLYDTDKTIAYTSQGTYISTDGKTWTQKATDQPKPNLTTKAKDGKYYGMTIRNFTYNLGGTGFGIPQFDQAVYTSANGIDWQLIPGSDKKGQNGDGPRFLSPDGTAVYSSNANPLGNMIIYYYISKDYGVTYESLIEGTQEEGFTMTQHVSRNGRYMTVNFEFDGSLIIKVCDKPYNGCKEIKMVPTFDSEGLYATDHDITYTVNDELLIPASHGIYRSSPL